MEDFGQLDTFPSMILVAQYVLIMLPSTGGGGSPGLCLQGLCHSHLSINVTKYLRLSFCHEKSLDLAHWYEGTSPW